MRGMFVTVDENFVDTSNVSLREISRSVAKDIIEKNHYSHVMPSTISKYTLGIFYTGADHQFFDTNERLIGCIVYGLPVGRHTLQSITDGLEISNVLELTRLWIADGYGKNIESFIIGQSFRWLRSNASNVKLVISYADPEQGHLGRIYQATNFLYQGCGVGGPAPFLIKITENGEWIHSRTVKDLYGVTTRSPHLLYGVLKHGYWRRRQSNKHRYLYFLCNKGEKKHLLQNLKYPILSYPRDISISKEKIEHVDMVDGTITVTDVTDTFEE